MIFRLKTPLTRENTKDLKVGDVVYISGTVFTARDAAHKKLREILRKTGKLPLAGEVVYYAGPCPQKPAEVIGSVGPTTSYRMDAFCEEFARAGLLHTIGKGERGADAKKAVGECHGVHFDAVGGAGAYYKNCVKRAEAAMFPELGAEAVFRLEVEDFPVVVTICADS